MNRGRNISHKKELVLAFFVGGATSAIAFDLSDYVFYNASATNNGALPPLLQAFLYAVFPALYYFGFFIIGYLLFRFTHVRATFIIYLYAVTIIIAFFLGISLPQNSQPFFTGTIILGLMVSLGILYGLRREIVSRSR